MTSHANRPHRETTDPAGRSAAARAARRFLPVAPVAPIALCCVFAASAPAQQPLDRIVAIVENEAITERQLVTNVERAHAVLARQNRGKPDERALAGQVLQQMIVEQLQLQEAKRIGINIDDITLDRAVTDTAERNGLTLAEFKQKVESSGENFQALRERMRKDLITRRLVQREVIDQIKVSEQEIENALASNADRGFTTEYRFAQIRVPPQANPEALAAAKQRLIRIRRQLRGDSFSSLAGLRRRVARLWKAAADEQKAPSAQLRYRIKDLGWRDAEALPSPVRRRLGTLRDVGVPVISNRDGVHVFQLLASRNDGPEMMQLQYRVRHVLMQTNPIDDDEKVRRTLLDVKRRLKNGDDFGALACEYSQDPLSAMQGGKLGWSNLDNYVPEFAEAVRRARGEGDVVGPFKTAFGWHLLEVIGTREQDVGDDVMRREAIAQIKRSKSEEETRLWLLRLRENRRIEIRI